jgi:hypothetical protein
MDNKKSGVVTTLSEKVVHQLMVFNKCTHERALCMYKEMMQTIADYYLMQSGVVTTPNASRQEIEAFAENVCTAYGMIDQHINELKGKLC